MNNVVNFEDRRRRQIMRADVDKFASIRTPADMAAVYTEVSPSREMARNLLAELVTLDLLDKYMPALVPWFRAYAKAAAELAVEDLHDETNAELEDRLFAQACADRQMMWTIILDVDCARLLTRGLERKLRRDGTPRTERREFWEALAAYNEALAKALEEEINS